VKVAILTNFNEFNPGYSLTGIVADQARMFERQGHEVDVWVAEKAHYNDHYDKQWPGLRIKHGVPRGALLDYATTEEVTDESKQLSGRIAQFLVDEISSYDVALTHDWVFTGWNLPYAFALMMTREQTANTAFLHWLHSIPSGTRDWWIASEYGPNHKLISPSSSNRDHILRGYRCSERECLVIPHIKDLRTWFDFSDETNSLIDEYPMIMQAKVVCVYPASSDRLRSKQVQHVIEVMGAIKKRNGSVCLVVPNQWSQGRRQREAMPEMDELADVCGLVKGHDFLWTSEFQAPKYEMGIPRRMVRELLLGSNLFMFPTTHESFGLAAPEAALCGNYLVLNADLDVSKEIFGHRGKYFSFGSLDRNFTPGDGWEEYLDQVGGAILARMQQEEAVVTRTTVRRSYNMDALYLSHYEPIIQDLRT